MNTNAQSTAWDNEYTTGTFLTGSAYPTAAFKSFIKWYKRKAAFSLADTTFIDVGCGNGRHARYLAEQGATGVGFDISAAVIQSANKEALSTVSFVVSGSEYLNTLADSSVQLIVDATTSHCFNQEERAEFIANAARILTPKGLLYSRVVAAENKHTAYLLQHSPGTQEGSYILPGTTIEEFPISFAQLRQEFKDFKLLQHKNDVGYTRTDGKSIRRNYWETVWQKLA